MFLNKISPGDKVLIQKTDFSLTVEHILAVDVKKEENGRKGQYTTHG